jgi:hypothetical protein
VVQRRVILLTRRSRNTGYGKDEHSMCQRARLRLMALPRLLNPFAANPGQKAETGILPALISVQSPAVGVNIFTQPFCWTVERAERVTPLAKAGKRA